MPEELRDDVKGSSERENEQEEPQGRDTDENEHKGGIEDAVEGISYRVL